MIEPIIYTYMDREWSGILVQNEQNTHLIPRVTPVKKGPPWPKREEYYGAVAKFKELTKENALRFLTQGI